MSDDGVDGQALREGWWPIGSGKVNLTAAPGHYPGGGPLCALRRGFIYRGGGRRASGAFSGLSASRSGRSRSLCTGVLSSRLLTSHDHGNVEIWVKSPFS